LKKAAESNDGPDFFEVAKAELIAKLRSALPADPFSPSRLFKPL
jgi:hypothetical protein